MAENHNKALSKIINNIVGKKIATVILEGEKVGFTLSDGRTVWVETSPENRETGWLRVER